MIAAQVKRRRVGACICPNRHGYGHHFLAAVFAASTAHFNTAWKATSVVGECLKNIGKAEYGDLIP